MNEQLQRQQHADLIMPQQQQQQQQQQQLQQDVYIQPTHISDDARELEKYGRKQKLYSVRAVVDQLMPYVYDRVDMMRSATAVDLRKSVLHHARGAEIVARNGADDVLEFDMAGSSFQTPRADYAGLKGKGKYRRPDGTEVKPQKQLKVSWYNRLRSYLWIPGVRTPEEIAAENLRRLANDPIYQRYGASQTINGVKHEHVRRKDSLHRTRFSIAGAQAMKGLSNSGEYSIEKTRGYMLELGKSYLSPIFDSWLDGTGAPHDVHILIRGHSRGGVSAIEGAMMLKYWLHNDPRYQRFEDRVKFELTQMDPVPGLGSRFGVNERVDLSGTAALRKGNDHMLPLGNSAETTVMYSLHTEHSVGFTPQEVLGAKRVIIMATPHSVSLKERAAGSVLTGGAVQDTQVRRASFTDADSGEVYRGSGINHLREGVYIVDEANTLVRLTSYEQAQRIIATILSDGAHSGQKARHEVIDNVIRAWFAAHAVPGAPAAPDNGA